MFRLLRRWISRTESVHALHIVLFFIYKAGIHRITCYRRPIPIHEFHLTEWTKWVKRFYRFIKNLHWNAINKLYIHIFQWIRNIFHFEYPSPFMYIVALFMFFLIWRSPFLLTIALPSLVSPANKRHLAEKKLSWYFNKSF